MAQATENGTNPGSERGTERRRQWGALTLATGLLLATVWGASAVFAADANETPAQVGTQNTATPAPQSAQLQPERPESAAEFSVLLAQTLLADDLDGLPALMAPEMRLVTWLGQRRVVEADEVMQDMAELYLGPAAAPYLDLSTDLVAFFGIEPVVLWGDDWNVAQVLFLRGLGTDGETDALLAVTEEEPGLFQWGGLLVAPFGFGLPPAEPGVLPTVAAPERGQPPADEQTEPQAAALLRIKRTTNVYPEPVFDVPPSGLVRSGQEVGLIGSSADGEYLQIVCVGNLEEPCWVVNDPAAVEIIGGPDVTPQPADDAGSAPTPTPASLAASGEPEEVTFARGEFATTRTGLVTGDAAREYLIRLEPRQLLYVSLASPGNVANFSVTGLVNGQPYKRVVNEERTFSFVVPVMQEYAIRVQVPADQTTPVEYALTIVALPAPSQAPAEATPLLIPTAVATSVPTLAPATPTPLPPPTAIPTRVPTLAPAFATPERVQFAPGQFSTERSGQVGPGRSRAYSLRVLAGQTVSVEIETPGNGARFSISGAADGVTYSGFDDLSNPVIFVAPRTQDYLVTVVSQAPADYILRFVVPPLEGNAPTPPPIDPTGPTRLTFAPGAVSTEASDLLPPYGSATYLLAAMAGQQATFVVQSPDEIADFDLVAPNGALLRGVGAGSPFWAGVLPMTGDYAITVYNQRGVRVQYTLEVTILPAEGAVATPLPDPRPVTTDERIAFGSGEETATVEGILAANGSQGYLLRAQAGQVIDVAVGSPQGDVGLTVVAPDGTPLKRASVGTPAYSGILPATGDYRLVAVALGPDAPYQLTVSVTN